MQVLNNGNKKGGGSHCKKTTSNRNKGAERRSQTKGICSSNQAPYPTQSHKCTELGAPKKKPYKNKSDPGRRRGKIMIHYSHLSPCYAHCEGVPALIMDQFNYNKTKINNNNLYQRDSTSLEKRHSMTKLSSIPPSQPHHNK